ncbi:MAG: Na+/H+ antiporter NhaC family protein, partial [Deltaproteobacteria bacterium]|nr:Na+/H+ antiporter NhaC family protein [Deltaproteobacteria bacterium]
SIVGLYTTGVEAIAQKGESIKDFQHIISNASTFQSLFWASLTGCSVAIIMSIAQRILTISEAMNAWFLGARSMLLAMIILTLAWSIGAVTKEMGTAAYLTRILSDVIAPNWIPTLTFVLAAITSFSTGSSWGTMAILIPLVLPLSWTLSFDVGLQPGMTETIFFATTASVLGGAIFGDHCSPISDTTVMSSMASSCNHIDHVRTQLPYAITIALICILGGTIPAGFGISPFVSLGICSAVSVLFLYLVGKKTACG